MFTAGPLCTANGERASKTWKTHKKQTFELTFVGLSGRRRFCDFHGQLWFFFGQILRVFLGRRALLKAFQVDVVHLGLDWVAQAFFWFISSRAVLFARRNAGILGRQKRGVFHVH